MKIDIRVLALSILILFMICYHDESANAQNFSAAFAAELHFLPAPFSLNATIFDLLLAASVPDTAFESHTQFDLSGLRSQQFSIELLLGALNVRDRLLFEPALDFERNALDVSVRMLGFNLALETILEDLGPPSPDINPGLVLEAGGRSSLGIGITSFTGFGVTQIVEDHDTIFSCVSIELRCLGEGYPDDEYDRVVVKPFLFSEQAVRIDWAIIDPLRLDVTPLFTLSGFEKLFIGASVNLTSPFIRFASLTTLDTSGGPIVLARQQITFDVDVGVVGWRAITIFSGAPIAFDTQTFKLRVSTAGFNLYTTLIFKLAGFDSIRLGAGFAF